MTSAISRNKAHRRPVESAGSNPVRCRRRHPRPEPGRHVAFTLIELLAVIAIIAMLVALLFPALQGARAKAKDAACASNMHQISVAMNAWMAAHNGNFLGPFADSGWWLDANGGIGSYGGGSLAWYNILGRFGYLGKPVKIHYPHIAQGWYGVCDQWKYPLLRDPAEDEWTTMPASYMSPSGPYMGAPYTAWLHSYNNSSYGMNWYVSQIVWCSCDRGATPMVSQNGYCCSRTYCGFGTNVFENMCCATGYQTLKAGVDPARALVIMDLPMPNWIGWSANYFWCDAAGYDAASWGANNSNVVHVTDPAILHAFRHGGRANGIFHDGHVEGFRPMEYVPYNQRVRIDIF